MTDRDQRMTADYQREVSNLVGRSVNGCLSMFIYALRQAESPEIEELPHAAYDYEETVRDHLTDNPEELAEVLDWLGQEQIDDMPPEDWRQVCEDYLTLDPYEWEVFEWWSVDTWLSHHLEERGEIVADVCGHKVWGRTTTGQAISIDGVICDIYDELQGAEQ